MKIMISNLVQSNNNQDNVILTVSAIELNVHTQTILFMTNDST